MFDVKQKEKNAAVNLLEVHLWIDYDFNPAELTLW